MVPLRIVKGDATSPQAKGPKVIVYDHAQPAGGHSTGPGVSR